MSMNINEKRNNLTSVGMNPDISVLLADIDRRGYEYDAKTEMVLENLTDKAYRFHTEFHKGDGELLAVDRIGINNGPMNRDYFFEVYEVLYRGFGITNTHKFIVINQLEPVYAYLTYIYGNSKKAVKMLTRLVKLDRLSDFSADIRITEYSDVRLQMTQEINRVLHIDELANPIINKVDGLKSIFGALQSHVYGDKHVNYAIFNPLHSNKGDNQYLRYSENYRWNYAFHSELFLNMANNRLLRLLSDIEYKYVVELLDILISRNDIDLHDFLETFTTGTFSKLQDNTEYHVSIIEFIRRIKGVNRNDFMRIMEFINFKRVNRARNVDIMLDNINFITDARARRSVGTSSNKSSKVSESFMLFDDVIHIENLGGRPLEHEIIYTKDVHEINTIGTRTLCCFKPGGLAKDLVRVAYQSPLSGIVEGKIRDTDSYSDRGTWFSFVWEMIDLDSDTGLFTTSLILDNIEASGTVPYNKFEEYVNEMYNHSNYNKIWLGSVRNDVRLTGDYHESTLIKRPYALINFEQEFSRYHYDDSRYIYDVSKIMGLEKNPKIKNINVRRADTGWFHRIQAVEKIIWSTNTDTDLNRINTEASPTYVITGDDNAILGYLITRIVKKIDGKVDYSYLTNKRELSLGENEEYVLLFEDIFLDSNRNVVTALKPIIEDLVKYVENNDIKYTAASANVSSSPLIKRLKKHTEFIEDTRFGKEAKERPSVTQDLLNKMKVDSSVFSSNLKTNNYLEEEKPLSLEVFQKIVQKDIDVDPLLDASKYFQ